MTVDEFCQAHPEYAFDFDKPIGSQPRVFEPVLLDDLPVELTPLQPYRPGGRGRPNPNQTLAHSQCATCERVLRNDFFYTPPSLLKRNVIYSHCRECTQRLNAERYETNAAVIRRRRNAIWHYLAPKCVLCGFDRHTSAMDLHHLDGKDAAIAELITALTLSGHVARAEALLREASQCVPLCSNCHRMLHAGVVELSDPSPSSPYHLIELMKQISDV